MTSMESLLTELLSAKTEEEKAWISTKFNLATQPQKLQNAVWTAAIPTWFDGPMLNSLLDSPLTGEEFEEFLALPYIDIFPGYGWSVHEKTRDLLWNSLSANDPLRFVKINRLSSLWSRKFHSADLAWRTEATIYSLLAKEKNSEKNLQELCSELLDIFQYPTLESTLTKVLSKKNSHHINKSSIAWALYYRAKLDYLQSTIEKSQATLDDINYTNQPDEKLRVVCKKLDGDIATIKSDYPRAKQLYHEAIEEFRSLKNIIGEANCLQSLAEVHHHLDDNKTAIRIILSAKKIYKDKNRSLGEGLCYSTLGRIQVIYHDLDSALKNHELALKIFRNNRTRLNEAHTLQNIACIYLCRWDFLKAQEYLDFSFKLYEETKDALGKTNCHMVQADLYMMRGEANIGKEIYRNCIDLFRKIGDPLGAANCTLLLGAALTQLGQFKDARHYLVEAESAFKAISSLSGGINYIEKIAYLEKHYGNLNAALIHYNQAASEWAALDHNYNVADSHREIGNIHLLLNNYSDAELHFLTSINIYDNEITRIDRADLFLTKNDLSSAEREIAIAEKISPKYFRINTLKGKIKFISRKNIDAIYHFSEAITQCPGDGKIQILQSLAEALSSLPWEESMHSGLAKIYSELEIEEILRFIELAYPAENIFSKQIEILERKITELRAIKISE
ncbi:tetratricopeptide repeat protein [Duganella vulcania]|uniref:Tetratricopeptide repeat protein n=1 Tax=Duganella vulcania TaxID=2692166 RepID=A0A845GI01_9BURK|nr:hypothetical protein [Duganella vulcania]MYM93062.1 hypothetical protein [Duganella vulcania]